MIIGGNYDTLATSIYLQITGALNKNIASAMALILLLLTMALFLLQKYWLERKATATLTGKAARGRILIEDNSVRIPLSVLAGAVSIFVIVLYILIPVGSLFNLWGRDYSLTLKWYAYTFESGGIKQYRDSITLALISAPITSLMSMLIAWMVVKKKFALKGYIEFISMTLDIAAMGQRVDALLLLDQVLNVDLVLDVLDLGAAINASVMESRYCLTPPDANVYSYHFHVRL